MAYPPSDSVRVSEMPLSTTGMSPTSTPCHGQVACGLLVFHAFSSVFTSHHSFLFTPHYTQFEFNLRIMRCIKSYLKAQLMLREEFLYCLGLSGPPGSLLDP